MIDNRFLYLSRADVEAAGLDIRTMIGLLEAAFREKGCGRVEMPPKPGIHTRPDAFLHAMPAYIPALRSAGINPPRDAVTDSEVVVTSGPILKHPAPTIEKGWLPL